MAGEARWSLRLSTEISLLTDEGRLNGRGGSLELETFHPSPLTTVYPRVDGLGGSLELETFSPFFLRRNGEKSKWLGSLEGSN